MADPWAMLRCGDRCLWGSMRGPRDRHCREGVLGTEVGQTVRSEVKEPNPDPPTEPGGRRVSCDSHILREKEEGPLGRRHSGSGQGVARPAVPPTRTRRGLPAVPPRGLGIGQLVGFPPMSSCADKNHQGHRQRTLSPRCSQAPAGAEGSGPRLDGPESRPRQEKGKPGAGREGGRATYGPTNSGSLNPRDQMPKSCCSGF